MKALYALVGSKYRSPEEQAVAKALKPGDALVLVREQGNQHDPNAIMVHARNTVHVGYLRAAENKKLAGFMDLIIKTKGEQHAVIIGKYVVDGSGHPCVEIEE